MKNQEKKGQGCLWGGNRRAFSGRVNVGAASRTGDAVHPRAWLGQSKGEKISMN